MGTFTLSKKNKAFTEFTKVKEPWPQNVYKSESFVVWMLLGMLHC